MIWADRVVPFAVEARWLEIDLGQLGVRDLDSGGVPPAIEFRLDA